MSAVSMDDAREVARDLTRSFPLEAVIVFGSVARFGNGNDLDLLIIEDENAGAPAEIYRELHGHLRKYYKSFSIDYFVSPPSMIQKLMAQGSPFLRAIQREGKCLYMKDSVKIWWKQAKDDLAMAHYLGQGGYFRGAAYHVQQAVEKAMKGKLIQKGWELERTHSIERLCAIGEGFGIDFYVPEELALFLESIYRGRYPAEEGLLPGGEPEKEKVMEAISAAEILFQKWEVA